MICWVYGQCNQLDTSPGSAPSLGNMVAFVNARSPTAALHSHSILGHVTNVLAFHAAARTQGILGLLLQLQATASSLGMLATNGATNYSHAVAEELTQAARLTEDERQHAAEARNSLTSGGKVKPVDELNEMQAVKVSCGAARSRNGR